MGYMGFKVVGFMGFKFVGFIGFKFLGFMGFKSLGFMGFNFLGFMGSFSSVYEIFSSINCYSRIPKKFQNISKGSYFQKRSKTPPSPPVYLELESIFKQVSNKF